MPNNNLYIVDNSSEEQSVKQYLIDWCNVSKQMDIATGYLEIGGLLSLDTHWQKVDKIRIILGNEVTKRTKDVIDEVVKSYKKLDLVSKRKEIINNLIIQIKFLKKICDEKKIKYKNGKIETDFGKPIYSSSSKYLTPQIMVYGFKDEEIELKIKLYSKNGIQRRGESSPQGYTYTSKVQCTKNEFTTCRLGGWGSDTRGYWNSDTYRLEIWYKDICLKKHDFTIY